MTIGLLGSSNALCGRHSGLLPQSFGPHRRGPVRAKNLPRGVVDSYLVFDTETINGLTRRLIIGVWQVWDVHRNGRHLLVRERILYAEELPVEDPEGFAGSRTTPAGTATSPSTVPGSRSSSRVGRRCCW